MADMPASTAKMLFGPESVPGVQEPLPQLIASGKLMLHIYISIYILSSLSVCLGLRLTEIQNSRQQMSTQGFFYR